MQLKTIWFDFDNSPHVPVLMPIAKELKHRGYQLYFTVRDVAQTVGLLRLYGVDYDLIGKEFSAPKYNKVAGTLFRALKLAHLVKGKDVVCCVSHSSRSAILAGWLLRKPILTMFDYEYVNSSFQRFLAGVIMMPQAVAKNFRLSKIRYYPGLKEHFYLKDYTPGADPFEELGVPANKIKAVFRLPAQSSHYHTDRTDEILNKILAYIKDVPDICLILSPRNKKQAQAYKSRLSNLGCDFVVADKVFMGGDMVFFADAIFTGGGTMAREAAVLGVPSYSFFMGQKGAVDEFLEDAGRLTFIRSTEELKKINLVKRNDRKVNLLPCEGDGVDFTVRAIEELIK